MLESNLSRICCSDKSQHCSQSNIAQVNFILFNRIALEPAITFRVVIYGFISVSIGKKPLALYHAGSKIVQSHHFCGIQNAERVLIDSVTFVVVVVVPAACY